jgi:hypothetical protein
MNLIGILASGVRGAESGSAQLRRRGTSTPATYYDSFEADGGAYTSDVVLDANGGATVYVNEVVDVTVYDSQGALVRSFTAGHDAPAVELKSQSFTGVNYKTGLSGAGEPTTLQAVMDLVKTSFGTTDFKVLVNSEEKLLSDVLFFTEGRVYNVVDYGATGDGVTDDQAAIQAALDAANADGGGFVYFPEGTYYIESALNVNGDITMAGDSRDRTKVLIDFDSVTSVAIDLRSSSVVDVTRMSFEYNSGTPASGRSYFDCAGTRARFYDCQISEDTVSAVNGETGIDVLAGDVIISNCRIYTTRPAGVSSIGVKVSGASTRCWIDKCLFDTVGAQTVTSSAISISAGLVFVRECVMDGASVLTAQVHDYLKITGGTAIVADCLFNNQGASSIAANQTAGVLRYSNCIFGTDVSQRAGSGDDSRAVGSRGSIDLGTDNSGTLVVDIHQYEYVYLNRSDGTAQTVTFTANRALANGSEFVLIVRSSSSATPTLTWAASGTLNFYPINGSTVLTANKRHVFRYVHFDGNFYETGTFAPSV